ncbi:MAG TPA: hypothetical protein VFE57_09650, partial [Cyclobacteriaceae bacterium]|nr:hypothetical protein [Cyclobacteriaceae bacterium]
IQGAISFTDNLAAIGSYSFLKKNQSDPTYTRKNSYGELGLGYFKNERSYRFELFLGYGQGKGTSLANYYFYAPDFGVTDIVATGKFTRVFIQPTLASNNKKFNIAFTPRISIVDFKEFTSTGPPPPATQKSAVTKDPNEKPYAFIEPALTGKFPLAGNLIGVFQLGLAVPTNSAVYFDYEPLQASVGIQLHVGGKLRTKVY